MSRHRNFRNLNYSDYFDDDSSEYSDEYSDDEQVYKQPARQTTLNVSIASKPIHKEKSVVKLPESPVSRKVIGITKFDDIKQKNIGLPAKQLSVIKIESKPVEKTVDVVNNYIVDDIVVIKEASKPLHSKVKWSNEEALAQLQKSKPNCNIVVIGHVDSGKSTLMGHLLHLLRVTDEKQLRKQTKIAQEQGKKSFAFAFTLDATDEERERGITMDVGIASFETEHRRFTILDAPGHKDFVPNMISGTSQADMGILVIDSSKGEFEKGFSANGQTKEHVLLAKSLGIVELVIVVNKCDTIQWNQERYNDIKATLSPFLSQVGYTCLFIPISGLDGLNITTRLENSWYTDYTLLEALDQLELPPRPIEKPFRMGLHDIQGTLVSGTISTGVCQPNQLVKIMPGNTTVKISRIYNNEEIVLIAGAGDSVSIQLEIDPLALFSDCVLCSIQHPIPIAILLRVQLMVMECPTPIVPGFQCIFYQKSIQVGCIITKLIALQDKTTNKVIKNTPRTVNKQQVATVLLKLEKQTCVDTFENDKQFGRFLLRKSGTSIGCGIILNLE